MYNKHNTAQKLAWDPHPARKPPLVKAHSTYVPETKPNGIFLEYSAFYSAFSAPQVLPAFVAAGGDGGSTPPW